MVSRRLETLKNFSWFLITEELLRFAIGESMASRK